MPWTTLCDVSDLAPDRGQFVDIDGLPLAVFLHAGGVHVMDDVCPHAGGSMSGGAVVDGCAVCPWHAWAFRLSDGQLRDRPGVALRTYPTRIREFQNRQLVQADLPMP